MLLQNQYVYKQIQIAKLYKAKKLRKIKKFRQIYKKLKNENK